MIYLLIIIGIVVCLGFGGWCGKLGCQSCEEEVKVLRRKLYEAEEEKEELKQMIADFPWKEKTSQTTSRINSKAINSEKA